MTMATTKKAPTKYRPIVLEQYDCYELPHRLVVREDGELEIQHRGSNNRWHRDGFAHADVEFPAQGCFPDV